MTYSMDNDARERARKRLAERTARAQTGEARVRRSQSFSANTSSRSSRRSNAFEDQNRYHDPQNPAFDEDFDRNAYSDESYDSEGYPQNYYDDAYYDEQYPEEDQGYYENETYREDNVGASRFSDRLRSFDVSSAKDQVGSFFGTAKDKITSGIAFFHDSFGIRGLIIAIAGIAVVIILLAGLVRCATTPTEEPKPEPTPEEQTTQPEDQQTQPETIDTSGINETDLVNLMGQSAADALVAEAQNNADAAWIASHPNSYDMDGNVVQQKILTLAANESEALPFVRNFPEKYPQNAGDAIDNAPTKGTIPTYYTWDTRWGYTVYSSTTFALTGSGPTALSMVYQGLTGNSDGTPYDMGVLANSLGLMGQFSGTDASFMITGATEKGLSAQTIENTTDALTAALKAGQVVIANVAENTFTDSTSFIVLTGIDEAGKISIKDPYSTKNTSQTWDAQTIVNASYGLYAYTPDSATQTANAADTSDTASTSDDTNNTPAA